MAGKHTAGPWRVKTTGNIGTMVEGFSGKPLFDGDDGYRCVALFSACEPTGLYAAEEENRMANARLIAAAPDLLEFAEYVRALAFDFVNEGIRPHEHHMRDLAWKADKIVSKATRATQPLPPPNEEV